MGFSRPILKQRMRITPPPQTGIIGKPETYIVALQYGTVPSTSPCAVTIGSSPTFIQEVSPTAPARFNTPFIAVEYPGLPLLPSNPPRVVVSMAAGTSDD